MLTILLLLLFLLLVLVTGHGLATLSRDTRFSVTAEEKLAAALGLGTVVLCFVPTLLTGLAGLFCRFEMGKATAILCSGALSGLVAWLAWKKANASFGKTLFSKPDWRFVAFLCGVLAVYLLAYDAHLLVPTTCALRAGVIPVRNYLSGETRMLLVPEYMVNSNAFLIWPSGIRLGPTFMIAPFLAWFDQAGLRILHAVCGVVIAAFTYATAVRLLNRKWAGYVAAAAMTLNPFILSIPHVDENILALAPMAGAFYFLMSPAYSSWTAGAMFGFGIGSRHVLLLALPALAFPYLMKDQRKKLLAAGAGLLVFCLPWIILHIAYIVQTGGIGYESFTIRPDVAYELFGYRFSLRAFLGWPFTDEPLRSPYNGYPTVISYPLTLVRTFGLLFCAAILAGLLKSGGLSLLKRLTSFLFFVPFTLMLMMQAGWEEPNKMGLFLVVSSPLALFGTAGIATLFNDASRRLSLGRFSIPYSPRGWISLAVCAVVVLVSTLLLRAPDYPLDERTFKQPLDRDAQMSPVFAPRLHESEKIHAAVDRAELAKLHFVPDLLMAYPLPSWSLVVYRVAEVWNEFADPAFNRRYTSFKDPENLALAIGLRPELLKMMEQRPAKPAVAEEAGQDRTSENSQAGGKYRDGLFGKVLSTEEFLPLPDQEDRDTEVDLEFLQLVEMIQKKGLRSVPMSMLIDSPFDEIYGAPDYYQCKGDAPDKQVNVSFDLNTPPVGNPRFMQVSGEQGVEMVPGQIIIIRDIPVKWLAEGDAHLMAFWSMEGAVNVTIYVGRIHFDHVKDDCFVRLYDWSQVKSLNLALPANQPLYVRQYTSVRPRCYHAWRGVITEDGFKLSLPFRTSY